MKKKSYFFRFGTANKKAKLITTTASVQSQQQQQQSNSNSGSNSNNSSVVAAHIAEQAQVNAAKLYGSVEEIQPQQPQSIHGNSINHNNYSHDNTRPGSSSSSCGPKLVNKQLVLPFVPPSFPNNSADGSNHLIKPSEYLKSITDKKSTTGSSR